MSETITILSPVPEARVVQAAQEAVRRLPANVRVGILSNGKPNSSHLLDGIVEVLEGESRYKLALREAKPSSSHPAEEAVLSRLMSSADLVVGATAD